MADPFIHASSEQDDLHAANVMEDTSGYLSGTPCYPRRDNSAAAGTAGSGVGGGGGGGGGGSDPLDRTWRRYYNKVCAVYLL